jgi:hypothetical protein
MIAASVTQDRSNRILRLAVVLSLLVHAALVLIFLISSAELSRLFHVDPRPALRKIPPDEIVTISMSRHVDKRAVPVPEPPSAQVAIRHLPARPSAAAAAPQEVATVPHPVVVHQRVDREPSLARHEISKESQDAPSDPALRRKAERVTQKPLAEKVVATVEHPAGAAANAQAPSRSNTLSSTQIAQIESDLAKTISQSRARVNPLRNVKPETPAAPKVYRIQMQGVFGALHRGEGYYYPIKAWRAAGLDWYYVSYDFTWADGTYESGSVPWAIHFTPATDPFATNDPSRLRHTPLPPPPAGFMPPGTLGKALRSYFPNLTFSDSDN